MEYGIELSGSGITAILGIFTSLALSYVPGFKTWWDGFEYKETALAILGLVITIALVGLHYAGALDLSLGAFGWPVVWQALAAWLAYSGAGQLTYTATKQ